MLVYNREQFIAVGIVLFVTENSFPFQYSRGKSVIFSVYFRTIFA